MFGFLKISKKPNPHWYSIGVQVAAIYEEMRLETPGAAYIFSNTLHSARQLVENRSMAIDQKITNVRNELAVSPRTADGGTAALALQFLNHLLEAKRLHDV